jgi:hypothetical protein
MGSDPGKDFRPTLKALNLSRAEERKLVRNLLRSSVVRPAAVLLGALMLAWPALFNGFPLLYPDSMTYLADGPTVARAVFLHRFSDYYGVRSFFYSLGILPFHWNLSAWPIVALQCLLVAWVIWLVVRSIEPRSTAVRYLILMLFLSALTSAGWYASFIMPDILGPVLYLAVYLLVFAPDTLSRAERLALYPIAVWSIASHATHLLLAAGLCLPIAMVAALPWRLFDRRPIRQRLWAAGEIATILAVAAALQFALHGYLYGKPSLNGERPPYLTARIIADGPGRWYLQKNCPQANLVLCGHLQDLSDDPDDFLWDPDGVYAQVSGNEQDQISKEEMPFVLATLRAYPAQQFARSAANFQQQLLAFGLYGFDPSPWILSEFSTVLPGARSSYLRSRQARDALPLDLLTDIQFLVVIASLGAIVGLVPLLWRRHSPRLAGLSLLIVSTVVVNALVAGVLSVVDDRYQCRVIWLIPLLAGLLLLDWLHQRETARVGATQESASA